MYLFCSFLSFFFFFNDTATTEIYTLSLHDALPIRPARSTRRCWSGAWPPGRRGRDRKSTRLNSSHVEISYAVFCLKKKKTSMDRSPAADSAGRQHLKNPVSLIPHIATVS